MDRRKSFVLFSVLVYCYFHVLYASRFSDSMLGEYCWWMVLIKRLLANLAFLIHFRFSTFTSFPLCVCLWCWALNGVWSFFSMEFPQFLQLNKRMTLEKFESHHIIFQPFDPTYHYFIIHGIKSFSTAMISFANMFITFWCERCCFDCCYIWNMT